MLLNLNTQFSFGELVIFYKIIFPKIYRNKIRMRETFTLLICLLFLVVVTQAQQAPQYSLYMFNKYSYEITSQQIMMKVSSKQGMPIKWDQIKSAIVRKDGFVLYLSKAQLFYFPFKIFNNDNEVKHAKSILERKGIIK